MEALHEKLMRIIAEDLRGKAELETLPNGRVTGDVISPQFEGKDYADRRALIRDAITRRVDSGYLTPDEAVNVDTLLTYTPDEWDVILTDTTD